MAKRIMQVTITYDLDHVLNYHHTTIDGKLDKAGNHLRNSKPVRAWYMKRYPDDELGKEINPELKWDGLFEKLRNGVCTYDAIGVGDSLIRERIDGHLLKMLGVPYMVLDAMREAA